MSDWRARAACRDEDPEIWHPITETDEHTAAARAICGRCPVQADCLQDALTNHRYTGVWAGTTTEQRAALHRERGTGPRRRDGRADRVAVARALAGETGGRALRPEDRDEAARRMRALGLGIGAIAARLSTGYQTVTTAVEAQA